MKTKIYSLLAIAVLVFSACKRDPDPEPGSYVSGVFILNEGAFQAGNAAVSFFNRESKLHSENIYQLVNGSGCPDPS